MLKAWGLSGLCLWWLLLSAVIWWELGVTETLEEAVYFCLTTITLIGYGDIAPTTTGTRLAVSVWLVCCLVLAWVWVRLWWRERHLDHWQRWYWALGLLVWWGVGLGVLVGGYGLSWSDSHYLLVMTATTVGYGDLSPQELGLPLWPSAVFASIGVVCLARVCVWLADLSLQSLDNWVADLTRKTPGSHLPSLRRV